MLPSEGAPLEHRNNTIIPKTMTRLLIRYPSFIHYKDMLHLNVFNQIKFTAPLAENPKKRVL
jgi:hypothetical protein